MIVHHYRTPADTVLGIQVSWYPVTDPDLRGYRLYAYGTNEWHVLVAETTLTAQSTTFLIDSPYLLTPFGGGANNTRLRVTAVDTVTPPNESQPSDAYLGNNPDWDVWDCFDSLGLTQPCFQGSENFPVLIVDGFDRYGGSGSWPSPRHEFVTMFRERIPLYFSVSSCANDAIIDGSVQLADFTHVFWILGDESTADQTFSASEQQKVKQFLEQGGKLFVSGSEVGWDLGRTHSATEPGDLSFYNNYLKASFVYDGTSSMTTAAGVSGQMFEAYTFTFGQTYPEDYPDDIDPVNGSYALLTYNATRSPGMPRIAGIAYEGTFGAGSVPGGLVYLAFPFETIGSELQRETLMNRVLQFFALVDDVERPNPAATPGSWSLSQNYPNPFNPTTSFQIQVPVQSALILRVYDALGRELETLFQGEHTAGAFTVTWDASQYPSGTYFVRLQAGSNVMTRKVLLVK